MKLLFGGLVVLTTLILCDGVFAQREGQKETPGEKKSYGEIDVQELRERLTRGDSLVLLDVRTKWEFEGDLGHLEGAILIPIQELEKRYHELDSLKGKEIVTYCRSGNRSARAAKFLTEKGFKAYNMLGGMLEWNKVKSDTSKKREQKR